MIIDWSRYCIQLQSELSYIYSTNLETFARNKKIFSHRHFREKLTICIARCWCDRFIIFRSCPCFENHSSSPIHFIDHSCVACFINSADLSAIHGTIVESCRPICQPSVASKQNLWADLSAFSNNFNNLLVLHVYKKQTDALNVTDAMQFVIRHENRIDTLVLTLTGWLVDFCRILTNWQRHNSHLKSLTLSFLSWSQNATFTMVLFHGKYQSL